MTNDLRRQLSAICTDRDASLWLDDIEAIRPAYAHTIHRREIAIDRDFNCFAFALQLTASRPYRVVASHSAPNVFANPAFITWLLDQRLLEEVTEAYEGAVVIYFADSTPAHAGIASGDRILSKWGTGWWFEHQLFEVPAGYGDDVAWYAAPEPASVERAFLAYAELKRVPVRTILARWLGAA